MNKQSKANSFFLSVTAVIFLLIPSISHADLRSGLVGWWTLDEGSGTTAYDKSSSGNNGTLTNGPTWVNQCKRNNCVNFDGSNDYINVPDSSRLQPNGSSWSISLWAKLPNQDIVACLISKRQNVAPYEQYNIMQAANMVTGGIGKRVGFCFIEDYNGSIVTCQKTNSDVADGNWHHLVVVFKNDNTYKIYVDTVDRGLTTDVTGGGFPTVNNTDPLQIGSCNSGASYFPGLIDDVRIYNRVLTAQEVSDLYKPGVVIRNAVIRNAVVNKK